jgi:superfamily II DNA or RNA helicase
MKLLLKNIAENIDKNQLSANWLDFDFENFSKGKKLYDFQREALENALKILWFYYEDSYDYQEKEDLKVNDLRKEKLFQKYLYWDLNEREVAYRYREERKHKFIFDYYPAENIEISFKHFVNRMCFWMATGSGKTLVIVKLIEFLQKLIKAKEIPDYDILFLTHREDLIKQFKDHLEEFNKERIEKINVYDLKEYDKVKSFRLFRENAVFYYRADLLSDESKEKIVDFRNYYNDGKWYIILDEAHKGDKEESKRQHIFSILSKNGFLFNFSATFDDIRDLVSTVYEFNLSTFIEKGYGKKIYISKLELEAFKNKEDFNRKAKQKVILKALILLTYIKKFEEEIKKLGNYFHRPLLLVLVNKIKDEISDLRLFFNELKNIAENKFDESLIEEAKKELIEEIDKSQDYFLPSDDTFKLDKDKISKIDYKEILKYVFNAQTPGSIEVSYNPSVKGEVAFKLKTSDSHFALSKTGAMPEWLKNELSNFEVNHQFEEEGFFRRINEENSSINILLGSRVFYEGWDSNRPNIIMFVNIGVREKARKFVLQSIGRGIRIEPIKNIRKRVRCIKNYFDEDIYKKLINLALPIESLFVFGTNKEAIETIVEETEKIKKETGSKITLSLFRNENEIKDKLLLIPKYKIRDKRLFEDLEDSKPKSRYSIHKDDLEMFRNFVSFLGDNRILAVKYDIEPKLIKFLKESLESKRAENYYKHTTNVVINNPEILMERIIKFWKSEFKEPEGVKELENEIIHYKNIVVELKEAREEDFNSFYELVKTSYETKRSLPYGTYIKLKYIPNHYYLPIVISEQKKEEIILKHIIKTESEVKFIEELERYLEKPDNKFKEFDWWMFSKIDESLDEVFIPYYSNSRSKPDNFRPDFIFWFQKGNNYYIVFIDPKGTVYREFEDKLSGYKELFEENGKPKILNYKNLNCFVYCYLKTDDVDKVRSSGYQKYWFENIEKVLENLI